MLPIIALKLGAKGASQRKTQPVIIPLRLVPNNSSYKDYDRNLKDGAFILFLRIILEMRIN